MIKPDAVERRQVGRIIARLEEAGFQLRAMQLTRLSLEEARRFYAVHAERPFYDDLCAFMSSGPCVPCLVEGGDDVIPSIRTLMGATDPAAAEPGTLRRDFATSKQANAVHGSDGPETARQEIAFFAEKLGWTVPAPAGD
ncbi:MAG: nucleoside-diphosphate kinase [Candidatus Eiseniibacteriota bacterium]|jgi:nucleoside-diphosphate kinase